MDAGLHMKAAHFPGRAPIDAFGNGGFRFADMSHRGSILCLPHGIHAWSPKAFEEIAADNLSLVLDNAEDIDVLLIGCGDDLRRINKDLADQIRGAGVVVETMATGAAVRTYNVLLAEERRVAAALIAVQTARR